MDEDINTMNACLNRKQRYSKSTRTPLTSTCINADGNNFNKKSNILGLNYCDETSQFITEEKDKK